MKILKQSTRTAPRVSLILLDWSVRESFHLLHYLAKQNVPRDSFEVVIIEYYSRVSDAIRKFEPQVDTWVVLEMPESCYYHKHLMYNAGIVLSRGEICVICDSDAMVREGFIGTIIGEFEKDPDIVLHLDQFRNMRRDFYPFNYPSFDQVAGEGCINNVDGKTRGVLDIEDPLHNRNYGACMCARRDDLIAIGGADEHVDYVGHICGPYDMTFRLINHGRREIWHQTEFMYHTWHPGQAGVDNYLGPHDGRHMSTTSLEALASGRVMPLVENEAIQKLRTHAATDEAALLDKIILPENLDYWSRDNLENGLTHRPFDGGKMYVQNYKGFIIRSELGYYYAHLIIEPDRGRQPAEPYKVYFEASSVEAIREKIDRAMPWTVKLGIVLGQNGTWAVRTVLGLVRRIASVLFRRLKAFLSNFIAGLKGLFSNAVSEKKILTDVFENVIPNLYYLPRVRPDLMEKMPLTLLIDSRIAGLFLSAAAVLPFFPAVRITRIDSARALKALLDEYSAHDKKPSLIVTRALFVKYYPIISADTHAKSMTIV